MVFHAKQPAQYVFKQLLAEWCLWLAHPEDRYKTKVKYLLRLLLNSDYA